LRKLALDLGIAEDVVWTGPVYGEEKWNAIRAAEVHILPSHQENFGISVVESMACGVPVLVSNKVNIWREISAAQAGLVDDDDVKGTSQLLLRWVSLTVEEKVRMGANARRCYEQHFGIATTNMNYLRLLMEAYWNRTKGPVEKENRVAESLQNRENTYR
jgi:glycosyltransferase involved in cell wall biosynthesis